MGRPKRLLSILRPLCGPWAGTDHTGWTRTHRLLPPSEQTLQRPPERSRVGWISCFSAVFSWSWADQSLQVCLASVSGAPSRRFGLEDQGRGLPGCPCPPVPFFSMSHRRCSQKLLKGAIPVPGPIRMHGLVGSSGSWNSLALKCKNMLIRSLV